MAIGYWLWAFALWGITCLVCWRRRVHSGASPARLRAEFFEEVLPIRWMLRGVAALCLGIAAAGGLLALRSGYAIYASFQRADVSLMLSLLALLGSLAAGLAALALARSLRARLEASHDGREIDVTIARMREGIDDDLIYELGGERFPNQFDKLGSPGTRLRWKLFFGLLAATVLVLVALFQDDGSLHRSALAIVAGLDGFYSWLAGVLGDVLFSGLVYASAVVAAVFLIGNPHYLYLTFKKAWTVIGCALFLAFAVIAFADNPESQLFLLALALGVCLARLIADFRRLSRFKARTDVLDPIEERLSQDVGAYAVDAIGRLAAHYPQLDANELDKRLDRGATNLGRDAFLAPPRFGRYMRDCVVYWRRASSAVARFMTVDRFVRLVNQRPTSERLFEIAVPVWDETQFPLKQPRGYVTWDDPLTLGPQWSIVRTCGSCGGSGRVSCSGCAGSGYVNRTETYYSGGQSRTRQVRQTCSTCYGSGRVICNTCSGCGRLKFDQQLVTRWRHEMATAPHPKMRLPDLVEGAAEIDFLRIPMSEDRVELDFSPRFGVDEDSFLQQAAPAFQACARANHRSWQDTITSYLDGRLYRSEVALCGFVIVRAEFGGLGEKSGWFFGDRPDFYFPNMPLGHSVIASLITVPPVLLIVTIEVLQRFAQLWGLIIAG